MILSLSALTSLRRSSSRAYDLKKLAVETLDAVAGALPGVGTGHEASHIINGLATGYDMLGRRMEWSDYALRGTAAAFGIVPFGSAAVHGVVKSARIAGEAITEGFIRGSQLLRESTCVKNFNAAFARMKTSEIPPLVSAFGSKGGEKAIQGLTKLEKVSEGAIARHVPEHGPASEYLGRRLAAASDDFASRLAAYGRQEKLHVARLAYLSEFETGASKFMTKEKYLEHVAGRKVLKGAKGSDTVFMTNCRAADRLVAEAGEKAAVLEKRLGFAPGDLVGQDLVRIDIPFRFSDKPRLPSGFEPGANELFQFGGTTRGGLPEVVLEAPSTEGIKVFELGVFK